MCIPTIVMREHVIKMTQIAHKRKFKTDVVLSCDLVRSIDKKISDGISLTQPSWNIETSTLTH